MQISPAHWHLLVNHFPIILVMTGALFFILGFIMKKPWLHNAALLLTILAAIAGFIANQTGEGAEESVEELPGISHQSINIHENAAETGLTIILITGVIAVITALVNMKNKKAGNIFMIIALIATLGSSAYMSYVGLTGGEIRHSEIRGDLGRGGTSATTTPVGAGEEEAGEDDD
jgi:uncharacterized membrane protein